MNPEKYPSWRWLCVFLFVAFCQRSATAHSGMGEVIMQLIPLVAAGFVYLFASIALIIIHVEKEKFSLSFYYILLLFLCGLIIWYILSTQIFSFYLFAIKKGYLNVTECLITGSFIAGSFLYTGFVAFRVFFRKSKRIRELNEEEMRSGERLLNRRAFLGRNEGKSENIHNE